MKKKPPKYLLHLYNAPAAYAKSCAFILITAAHNFN